MTGTFNPYLPDVCDWPPDAPCGVSGVNEAAFSQIEGHARAAAAQGASTGHGRLVLLAAPDAGFGKTHLLARFGGSAPEARSPVPLCFDREHSVSWPEVTRQVLQCFHGTCPPGSELNLLGHLVSRLVAKLNEDLIQRGLVRCENEMITLRGLQANAVDVYDLSDPERPVAQWFNRNFEALLPACAETLRGWAGLSEEAASEWLRVLFAYGKARRDTSGERWRSLVWGIRQISQAVDGCVAGGLQPMTVTTEGEHLASKERVTELLRIFSILRLPVLTVDGIDAFYGDKTTGLRLSNLLAQLPRAVPRSLTVLSVNDDLWEATFGDLPGALRDRLTSSIVRLGGLSPEAAASLIRFRLETAQPKLLEEESAGFLRQIDISGFMSKRSGLVSPRALLRHASRAFERLSDDSKASTLPGSTVVRAIPNLFPDGEPRTAPAPRLRPHSKPETRPFAPSAVAPPQKEPGGPVAEAFRERMQAIDGEPKADPVEIAALLRIAGQHFPVVRYQEVDVPSLNGSAGAVVKAGTWETRGMHLMFGVSPYSDSAYWELLQRFAGREGASGARLALFSAEGDEVPFPVGEVTGIDAISLSREAVRRITAASRLLQESERGDFPIPVAETLAGLVDDLNFFWKRLTREKAS